LAKDFLTVGIFTVIGIGFIVVTLIAAWVFRPHKPTGEKLETYECGEKPIGPAWVQFRVGYYIYALIFLIFDVEAVFLFPWASSLKHFAVQNPAIASFLFIDMVIFVFILALGLIYAYKKGVLEWK
jgi:NADH:ubiquinone oxidoreductase subunit 3 (subunit A)